MNGQRFTVRHHSGEFGCPHCGEPVMVGDSAWHDRETERVFCSRTCAKGWKAFPANLRSREPSPGFLATQANANSGQ